MGNHRSRTSTSIFDEDEKEFIYKLPLNYDKYYYLSIYRIIGKELESRTFSQVVEFKLLLNNHDHDHHYNYPFHKQIESNILPYVGDDSKERLMRKHSKFTLSNSSFNSSSNSTSITLTNSSSTNSSSHPSTQFNHNILDLNSNTSHNINNIRKIYDSMYSTMEEYHFLHPNNDSSTINMDVIVMRRNGFDQDLNSNSNSNSNSNLQDSILVLIGAVSDSVSKEDRKLNMSRVRDLCIDELNQCGSTMENISIPKEDQALKKLNDQMMKLLQ